MVHCTTLVNSDSGGRTCYHSFGSTIHQWFLSHPLAPKRTHPGLPLLRLFRSSRLTTSRFSPGVRLSCFRSSVHTWELPCPVSVVVPGRDLDSVPASRVGDKENISHRPTPGSTPKRVNFEEKFCKFGYSVCHADERLRSGAHLAMRNIGLKSCKEPCAGTSTFAGECQESSF